MMEGEQIRLHSVDGDILYSVCTEDNTYRRTLRQAVEAGENLGSLHVKGGDLSEMDLSGSQLIGAVVESCRIRQTAFTGFFFTGGFAVRSDLSGSGFSYAQLDDSTWEQVTLDQADLTMGSARRARFVESHLKQADGSGTDFNRAQFITCDLFGSRWIAAHFQDVLLEAVTCEEGDFQGLLGRGSTWDRCRLSHCTFNGADLSGSNWSDSDLPDLMAHELVARAIKVTGGNWSLSKVTEADLSEAVFEKVHANGTLWRRGRWRDSRIEDCQMAHCDFSENDFEASVLRGTSFAHSVFCDSRLVGSHWENCDLKQCDLRGADVKDCRFVDCDLTGALRRVDDDPIPGWSFQKNQLSLTRTLPTG